MQRLPLRVQPGALDRELDDYVASVERWVGEQGPRGSGITCTTTRVGDDRVTLRLLDPRERVAVVVALARRGSDGASIVHAHAERPALSRLRERLQPASTFLRNRYPRVSLLLIPVGFVVCLLLIGLLPPIPPPAIGAMFVALLLSPLAFRWVRRSNAALQRTEWAAHKLTRFFGAAKGTQRVELQRALPAAWSDDEAPRVEAQLQLLARSSLDELAQRGGKVVGRVRRDADELRSPMSERRCAYFKLVVKESKFDLDELAWGPWTQLPCPQRDAPFLFEHDAGVARVEPRGASIASVADFCFGGEWGALHSWSRRLICLHAQLSDEKIAELNANHNRYKLIVSESVLEFGEQIVISGLAVTTADPDATTAGLGGYRAAPPERQCLVHSERAPLLISDNPACFD